MGEVIIGLTYDVLIRDCCVEGEFSSKVISIEKEDENEKEVVFKESGLKVEYEYGSEIEFANGVKLRTMGGVELKLKNAPMNKTEY